MKIRAIRNHIIFKFDEETVYKGGKQQFKQKSDAGIEVVDWDDTSKRARWGTIVKVGHEATDEFKPGMRVLIDALMWTPGFKLDNDEILWRTDSTRILAVDPTTE